MGANSGASPLSRRATRSASVLVPRSIRQGGRLPYGMITPRPLFDRRPACNQSRPRNPERDQSDLAQIPQEREERFASLAGSPKRASPDSQAYRPPRSRPSQSAVTAKTRYSGNQRHPHRFQQGHRHQPQTESPESSGQHQQQPFPFSGRHRVGGPPLQPDHPQNHSGNEHRRQEGEADCIDRNEEKEDWNSPIKKPRFLPKWF